ncbi:ribonuclease D [Trichlorobacter sp.]|jgi:ribonuclease D|uniref:ribonuclease D n=1 Tax=Trichlorobacter sp. TaxID=2911007 RepID=UPI002A365B7D|nr:HRDC domain-containing protein [Trichlorobacter sp.]MDY0385051.1 HRDC domain-containing protein [Trichlorobacter sp.]
MPGYTLIECERKLSEVCHGLRDEPELALDLEADSLHHYREKVCLLQLSTRSATWLIDPLLVNDLAPLGLLLADPERLIVFHGGDYDIRSLHRDFGISVGRMYDTMIAAQFIGLTEFGLAALLRSHFGVELDKRFQKADWSQRPLTADMANYAAHDTAHLLQLADSLRAKVEELGRSGWVAEECALVAANRMVDKGEGPLFLHCKGAGKLQRRNLAILEQLLQLRDSQARQLDRPPFKVMSSESLLVIAERQLRTVHEMSEVQGLTPRVLNRYGGLLEAAVQRGLELPEGQLPRFPRSKGEPNPGIKARIAQLKKWREQLSAELQLATGLVAPNWLLERIAEQRPDSIEQLAAVPGIRRWQLALWGATLVQLLAQPTDS